MDRKDWASLTDEVIMDLENMNTPLARNLAQHPIAHTTRGHNPIGLLIAEIKRLRVDVERLRERLIE